VYEWVISSYDQKVWDVVKHHRYAQPEGRVVTSFSPIPQPKEIPYTTTEIAERVVRRESLVTFSLKRLEKRGKVVETHEGWKASN
jgi:hypothetical protein